MESIVFFGKGGIGKSTVASNVSAILAARGRKVLHVGCDPKGDSTLALTGRRVKHFADGGVFAGEQALRASIHPSLFKNISCVEAGGPQAGVGCAGAGIGAMLDIMKEFSVLEKDGYDAVVFDVLGDVVCGGFAAPLRRGLAGKAVIVVSEEMLSLYAANKLVAMVNNYARNGVWLAGLAVNAKDQAAVRLAQAFAAAARTRVLGVIPRDPAVARAEKMHRPVTVTDARSPAAAAMVRLAAAIQNAKKPEVSPRPLSDQEFQELFTGRPAETALAGVSRGDRVPPAERLRRAGFTVTGIAGGQALASWRSGQLVFNVIISSASDARPGMTRSGDWAVCFAPDAGPESSARRGALDAAAAGLSGVTFDDFFSAFGGGTDFYRNINAFEELASHSLPGGGAPREPHVGFGQWHRFVFPGAQTISVPPGVALVEHGEAECRFSSAARTPLSALQRSAAGLAGSGLEPVCPGLPKEDANAVNTGFTYADAVLGDGPKVEAALGAAARMTGKGGLVELYNTCSPMLLATDLKAHAGRVAAAEGVKISRYNLNSFYLGVPEKTAARAAYAASRLKAMKRRRAWDVNLCGFGASRGALEALLKSAGLSAAPEAGDFYATAAGSALQVLPEPDPVLEKGFAAAGYGYVVPPAPYGLAASGAWLKAVTAALGRRKSAALPKAALDQYDVLSKKLARFAVAFVGQAGELGCLRGAHPRCGVPALDFLAEAGMKLRLLVYAPAPEARAAAAAEVKRLPAGISRRVSLAFFSSPEELNELLKKDKALRLVYSDIPMDPRAAAAGKTALSPLVFEPGYEGAAETLRRLEALCRWNFNERYPSR